MLSWYKNMINNHTDSLAIHLDTIKQLRHDVNLKLPIADTSSMLTPYMQRKDTATMLLPYVKTDGSRPFTATQQGVFPLASNDLVTKQYVDNAISFIEDLYFTNYTADVSGYYRMVNDAVGEPLVTFNNTVGSGANQLMLSFVSDTSQPGVTLLKAGVYEAAIHAYISGAGSLTTKLYYSLYLRDTLGNETLLGTSPLSPNLTSVGETYNLSVVRDTVIEINPKDRLVAKVYANVTGGGGTTEALSLEIGNGTGSRLSLPTSSEILSTIFLRQDGTTQLNADWNAGNHTITSGKFTTIGGTSSQFVKGDGTLDGTAYLPISDTTNMLSFYPRKDSVILNQNSYSQNANFNISGSGIIGDTTFSSHFYSSKNYKTNFDYLKSNLTTALFTTFVNHQWEDSIGNFLIDTISNAPYGGSGLMNLTIADNGDSAAQIGTHNILLVQDTVNNGYQATATFNDVYYNSNKNLNNGIYNTYSFNWIKGTGTVNNADNYDCGFKIDGAHVNTYEIYDIDNTNMDTVNGGSIGELYGIYLHDITLGTNQNYAIYTNKGKVHFGDNTDVSGDIAAIRNGTNIPSFGVTYQYAGNFTTRASYITAVHNEQTPSHIWNTKIVSQGANAAGWYSALSFWTTNQTTAPVEAGRFDYNGYLLLGYTQSQNSSKLQVNGNGYFNGNVTATGVVTGSNLSGTNTGDQTLSSLGAQAQLNGTGFVKASGTTISYDNTTYQPLSTAWNTSNAGSTSYNWSANLLTATQVNPTNLSTGYIPYYNGSYLVNSPISVNSGNIMVSSTGAIPLSIYRSGITNVNAGGGLDFMLDNSSGTPTTYGRIYGQITDPTAGSESGYLGFRTINNGTISEVARLTNTGSLFVGYTADPTSGNKLAINGNGYFNGTVISTGAMTASDFILSSDSTLKHDIKPLTTNVSSVPFVQFKFKSDTTNRERYGVIAQDLQKVDSNMVYVGQDGKLKVSYIGFLVARLANDEAKIDSLKAIVEKQQKQIEYILKMLNNEK